MEFQPCRKHLPLVKSSCSGWPDCDHHSCDENRGVSHYLLHPVADSLFFFHGVSIHMQCQSSAQSMLGKVESKDAFKTCLKLCLAENSRAKLCLQRCTQGGEHLEVPAPRSGSSAALPLAQRVGAEL